MTLCASFCWKSLSRPFLCNLDSTPPQVINAAANDGEPGVGGQSPTSQDFAPIQDGLPEISARFCNRPDFTSAKKARAAPLFYLGGGLLKKPVNVKPVGVRKTPGQKVGRTARFPPRPLQHRLDYCQRLSLFSCARRDRAHTEMRPL